MAVLVPPVPYKIPMLTDTGFLTDPWAKWFRAVYVRMGGSVAESNSELASSSSVVDTTGELNQGPVL
jgi:hypothetical protein